jgi:hypothetical protein
MNSVLSTAHKGKTIYNWLIRIHLASRGSNKRTSVICMNPHLAKRQLEFLYLNSYSQKHMLRNMESNEDVYTYKVRQNELGRSDRGFARRKCPCRTFALLPLRSPIHSLIPRQISSPPAYVRQLHGCVRNGLWVSQNTSASVIISSSVTTAYVWTLRREAKI